MRVTSEPFDNLDLRLALKHSIKRQELVDKILLGHGSLGNDHPISTANPFHASNLPQREFNPELAMKHYKLLVIVVQFNFQLLTRHSQVQ